MDYVIIKDAGGNALIFTHSSVSDDATYAKFVAQSATASTAYETLIEKLMWGHTIRYKTGGADVSGVTNDATLAVYLAANDYDEDYTLFEDRA